jgi:hypothetical protein
MITNSVSFISKQIVGWKVLPECALMVFKIFQKIFDTLYNYLLFICFFEITYCCSFENAYRY